MPAGSNQFIRGEEHMKKLNSIGPSTVLGALAVVLVLHAPMSYAGDDVTTMAGIALSLQHFPSDADKTALAAITSGDASAAEKAIAQAIAGLQHAVSANDKAALEAIAADDSQPARVRELAGIVARINHVPDADAKAALAKLSAD